MSTAGDAPRRRVLPAQQQLSSSSRVSGASPSRPSRSQCASADSNARTRSASARATRSPAAGAVKPRKCYVVGTMRHCGSIYEELTRQLLLTGRWTRVQVRMRAATKQLYVEGGGGGPGETDISDVNIHLLLGEKPPTERLIAFRRTLSTRASRQSQSQSQQQQQLQRGSDAGKSGAGAGRSGRHYPANARVPLGNGSDGEHRVVDFIENTRCITLKSAMVATLLRYYHNRWDELGTYLPMSFQLSPRRQSSVDDRDSFLAEVRRVHRRNSTGADTGDAAPPLWIAKSSSGCHGDNIEIFPGTPNGAARLLAFVDGQKQPYPWVAQAYVARPLLYHKRKFDIRCWILVLRESFEVFVHDSLVMRTSSVLYDTSTATANAGDGRLAHITNHCVQSTGEDYSRYEEGNELWREHLDGLVRYKAKKLAERRRRQGATDTGLPGFPTLRNTILPQIHHIVRETMLAARPHLVQDPNPPPTYCFQVFGYDFLIDEELHVWLLEINGAPGGAERLLPTIMRDTIELAVEPHFPGSFFRAKDDIPNGYTRVYPT